MLRNVIKQGIESAEKFPFSSWINYVVNKQHK